MDKLEKILKRLPTYLIQVGVFSEENNREKSSTRGVTNAELMFLHEEGSYDGRLHGYKVLEKTIDYTNKNLLDKVIDKGLTDYLKTGNLDALEKQLNRLCVKMENYARDLIYDNDVLQKEKMNSYETAKRKWKKEKGNKGKKYPGLPAGSHPLFDTGQLSKSITGKLKKIGR